MALYVHFGCQWCAPYEWVNFDSSPTLRIERIPLFGRLVRKNKRRFPANVYYGDIVKGLPIENCSCTGVYSSHVLEHLSYQDCLLALKNTYLMLKIGGIFRTVLPNLENYIDRYMSNNSANRANEFMIKTGLGQVYRPKGFVSILADTFGNSRHRWMWDFPSLQSKLDKCGFKNIRCAKYGDSMDSMFRKVEQRERWDHALGIECEK